MLTKKIGGMATIRSREKTLESVIASVAKQLDILYIYFNDHEKIPDFLVNYLNVVAVLGKESYGDMNANGKLYGLERESQGIFFTLDDDIIYPDNYVSVFMEKMDRFEGQVCLSVHGSTMPDHSSWYYERREMYPMRSSLIKASIINLVGSGTAAFPITIFEKVFPDIHNQVYVDLQISLAALSCGIPILAIERPAKWLTVIEYDGLWEKFKLSTTHHTLIMNKSVLWRSDAMRAIWNSVLNHAINRGIDDPASYFNLDAASIGFIHTGSDPTDRDNLLHLKTSLGFVHLWSS